ncbi:RNA-directed DNA polymerase, eukaryota, reverse transcriptase zinc-binding domain protein, partial [Tanacetum coccineum]
MVIEGLLNAFEEAVGNGLITGVNINNSTINVSHLLYAYDVIITTDWNAKDMDNIIRVLHVFYLASGLKINIHKSNIYGIEVNKDEVLSMASNAGCIAGDIPFNYLGLPIGSNMKSIASWKTLVVALVFDFGKIFGVGETLFFTRPSLVLFAMPMLNLLIIFSSNADIATDMWKLVFRWCDIPLFQASSWDSFNDWIISWHASKEKKH